MIHMPGRRALPLPTADGTELRHCFQGLEALMALSATAEGRTASESAGAFIDALVPLLDADFGYVWFGGATDDLSAEVATISPASSLAVSCDALGSLLRERLGAEPREWPHRRERVSLPGAELSVASVPLGAYGEVGTIVIGARRNDFPRQTESLLLHVAATRAAIGLQALQLLGAQRRLANELDARVALRTAELAAANEELRRAEAAARAGERALSQIINAIPALAWSALPDGTSEFHNQSYIDYTGLTAEQMMEWKAWNLMHADDLDRVGAEWNRLLALKGEGGEMEARLRRHDGQYRWCLIRVSPLRDASGNIIRWYGINTDIDDRKRAEQELRRSEAFLAEGQRLSMTGSFSWAVETNELVLSEELYRILELPAHGPLYVDRIAARVHPDDRPSLADAIESARAGGGDLDREFRLLLPDGRIKRVRTIARGMPSHHGAPEYIGAVQDVTAQHLSEAALGKVRSDLAQMARVMSLGALTASIAHEVNQPLSGIITNASTSLRMLAANPPNVAGALETARRTIRDGQRASDVISRLRALFSQKAIARELVDLNEAALEVIALSTAELQQAHVVLRTEFYGGLPPVVGDRVQLQQVIMNLLRNAVDAMSGVHERPRLLVIRIEPDDGAVVRVSVQDAGIGLDRGTSDRLFEAFYTTKETGMGIGLSVSRTIIESHGGQLWAQSNDGPGATFTFVLPQALR